MNVDVGWLHVGRCMGLGHVGSYSRWRRVCYVGRLNHDRWSRVCDCFRNSDRDGVRDCDVLCDGLSDDNRVSVSVAPGPNDDGLHDRLLVVVGLIMMAVVARASRDDDDVPVVFLFLFLPLVPLVELPDESRVSN